MFDGRSKSLLVILASILFLPLSILITLLTILVALPFRPTQPKRTGITVLISGGRSSQALVLARQFRRAGHRVILAEEESSYCGARFSACVDAFYTLPDPVESQDQYNSRLVDIVRKEKVDIFVPCCTSSSLLSDGTAKRALSKHCQVVQFDEAMGQKLQRKDSFISAAEHIGLDVPTTFKVTHPKDVLYYDFKQPCNAKKQFVLRCVGSNDKTKSSRKPTLLPIDSFSSMAKYLEGMEITTENPYILQEYVIGTKYFCHALTWNGSVRTFSAHSSDQSSQFQNISPLNYEMSVSSFLDFEIDIDALEKSRIAQKMQDFVTAFASNHNLTGPLSVTFIATKSRCGNRLQELSVLPISADPRTSSSISCFYGSRGFEMAFTRLAHNSNNAYHWPIFPSAASRDTYLFYHELYSVICNFRWFTSTPRTWKSFVRRVWREREVLWDLKDPWPFLAIYHWQWPMTLLKEGLIRGRRWRGINVASGEVHWK